MKRPNPPKTSPIQYFLAGGSVLFLVAVLADMREGRQPPSVNNLCQEMVQPQSVLSREELSQLLAVPERGAKASVRSVVSDPYCRLGAIEIRQGVLAEREAYPLAFDPQTWFVVLYEGEEYAGYSFVFQR